MSWIAVNKYRYIWAPYVHGDSTEFIFNDCPHVDGDRWFSDESNIGIQLPKGTIKKLIGRNLTFDDGPINIVSEDVIDVYWELLDTKDKRVALSNINVACTHLPLDDVNKYYKRLKYRDKLIIWNVTKGYLSSIK